MESQILHWILHPESPSSVFRESRFFRWLSKGASRFSSFRKALFSEKVSSLGKWLLCFLLFSSLFVPRISMGSVFSFYSLDLRVEDLLLALLGGLVFARMLYPVSGPEIPLVERAFLGFLLVAEVSLFSGLFLGTIDKPFLSLLYLLKWFEYFLVLVIAARLSTDQKKKYFFLTTFFFLGIAVAGFGYWEHFFPAAKGVYPNYYRLYERPPFHGDANHMGGFLVLWLGVFTGLFLKTEKRLRAGIILASLLFVFFPLIWTYSRKSYFALAGTFLFSLLFLGNRKKLLLLICLFVIFALMLPTRLSERLLDLEEALTSTDPFHSSWAGNFSMWQLALWNFEKYFLFGSGLGSRHRLYYESQYVLILSETGVFGLIFFSLLCLSLIRQIVSIGRQPLKREDRGVTLGWLMGFIGLLIHNTSCVSWTVSKIAIPFWFLTAVVLTPPPKTPPF